MSQWREILRSPEVSVPGTILLVATVGVAIVLILARLEAALAATLIAGVLGAYGTVISLILSRFYERQRAVAERRATIERDARAKKIPVYEDFVGFWLDALFRGQLGKKPLTQQQIMQGITDWTKPILMWGSDEVVREWGRLKTELASPVPGDREPLFRFERFLVLLRHDAGYPDTQLGRGDLLRLFVTDIDEYM